MNTLKVQKGSTVLMNNTYTYDAVQNITGIVSSDITQGAIGGSMSHQYRYDNLNRLDSAWGSFVGPNSKKADYTLGLSYDNLHNINRKTQDIVQQNLKFNGILSAGYNLSYTYANNSQQIANIADASYRADRSGGAYGTGRQQTDVLNEKAQSFTYDANGNMTYVATSKKLNDSTLQATTSRQMLWDEENRLLAISDNGYVSNYWYDAAGERTVKQSGGSEGVFVNGVLSGANTETGKFTAYISPYMVVSNGGNYSKHNYMGSQRIVSKLSNSGIFAASPVTAIDQQVKYARQTSKIKERFDSLGVIYNGTPQTGGLVSVNPASTASSYFYHPDHLGSSSLITDGTGALTQHIQYVPFGEVFVEERTNSWSTPYKFNGKELDEETGLYYYHARYYDPRLSVWLSVDPLAEKKPNFTSYNFCSNNPINRIDPDGLTDIERKIALEIAESLIGTRYKSPLPQNERVKKGQLDCSGLVRYSIMQNSTISDPFNSTGNGVTQLINSSQKTNLNNIRDGDIVVIASQGNDNGHIGFVKNIIRDNNGDVTEYTMLHSESSWTNSSGQSGGGIINETVIKVGSERGYAKSKYNHRFYQWDNPESSSSNSVSKSSINLTIRQLFINQAPPLKLSEKMMQSKINIINDIGHIINALGY